MTLSKRLGVSPTIWDEEKKIFVTNPVLIEYE
jgi:hypothetical protein